ncbi:hypothetical protein JW921_06225 [Candidatus Fermentibacterales bacterium]|nr:hypothetical protein [Candidatus Fermentibacterales bacterium]
MRTQDKKERRALDGSGGGSSRGQGRRGRLDDGDGDPGSDRSDYRDQESCVELVLVVFRARRTQIFANTTGAPVDIGHMVVVSVDRGEDIGRVLSKLSPLEQQVPIAGEVLRTAGRDDIERDRRNRPFEERVLEFAHRRVAARNLEMKLTGCESQLDRKRIRVYFTADSRMDFRDLVRDLAAEYHARIEMRQLGVRDDARHKDGVGICGRRLCCAGFLGDFSSVTLRAVREQHLSPNPAKVSGVCSRLMCCLAYEYEFYRKANRAFPEPGSVVKLGKDRVMVDRIDIFNDSVRVIHEDERAEDLSSEEFHRRKEQSRRRTGQSPDEAESPAGD